MKIVLAPDSFKESLTAEQVCQAMQAGIKDTGLSAKIIAIPMADGGDGTMDALVAATNGRKVPVSVMGPLGKPVQAAYGLLGNGQTAVIEMAQASGIGYVKPAARTPQTILKTTTFGTGQLVEQALKQGVKKLMIGLGGSATNDGGAGLAQALGVEFFDQAGKLLSQPLGGGDLDQIAHVSLQKLDPRLAKTNITLASDVTNPLVGPQGASFVFGQQKGADQTTMKVLDSNLQHYAQVIAQDVGKNIAKMPGSGAAGGLGGGLLAFTKAAVAPGFQVVAQEVDLKQAIQTADLVLTGEGQTDRQTQFGKTPYGVAQLAKTASVPVVSLAGSFGPGCDELYAAGFTAFFNILPCPCSLEQALTQAADNIRQTTANVIRLWQS